MKLNVLIFSTLILVGTATSLECFLRQSIPSQECIRSISINEVDRVEVALAIAQFCRMTKMYKEAMVFYGRAQSIEPNIDGDFGMFRTLLESQHYFDAMTTQYGLLAKYGFAYTSRIDQILKQTEIVERSDQKDQMAAKYYSNDLDQAMAIVKKHIQNNEFGTEHLLYERILEKSKNYYAALQFVKYWLKKQPSNFYLHHLQGTLQMQHLKFSQAIKSFQESIRLQPVFQLSRYSLALCQQQTGKFHQSLETLKILEKIVKQQPWGVTWSIFNAMGYSYQQLKMYKEAQQSYRKALTQGNVTPQLTHYNIANLYYQTDRYEQALKQAKIAYEIDNNMQMPRILMAHCLKQLNRHQEAIKYVKNLTNVEALTLLAEIYYEIEDKEAENMVDRVISLDQTIEQAHIIKGLINQRKGLFDKALKSYQKCQNQDVIKMKIRLMIRMKKCSQAKQQVKKIQDQELIKEAAKCDELTDL